MILYLLFIYIWNARMMVCWLYTMIFLILFFLLNNKFVFSLEIYTYIYLYRQYKVSFSFIFFFCFFFLSFLSIYILDITWCGEDKKNRRIIYFIIDRYLKLKKRKWIDFDISILYLYCVFCIIFQKPYLLCPFQDCRDKYIYKCVL